MNRQSDTTGHYSWRSVAAMVGPYRSTLIRGHLVAVLGAAMAVPVPLLLPLLVDEVLLGHPGVIVEWSGRIFPTEWQGPVLHIAAILMITLLLRLATLLMTVYQSKLFSHIARTVTCRLREELLQRLGRVAMAEYETLGSGAVSARCVTDIDQIDEFLGTTLSKLLVAVLMLVGAAAVLLWMHWQMALFILLLNPVVVYLTVTLGRKTKKLKKRENQAIELFQESLAETLEAIQQVRVANRADYYLGRVARRARTVRDHADAYAWRSEAAGRLSFLVFLFGFDTFRAISMVMVLFADLTIGEMFAVYGYLWFMMGPVQEVLNIQYAHAAAAAALERINRLFDLPLEESWEPATPLPATANPFNRPGGVSIELKGVTFRYRDGPAVLDRLDLSIAAGERVALVGTSGGGKTTLIQLLLGLYSAESGSILFGGVPVEQTGIAAVREHCGVVLQHPALFNDTIRNNLTMGREVAESVIQEALEIARLDTLIDELPEGLETAIGRQGIRLSGGQRQRLAVARLVVSDPQIAILDEATSALDTTTEAELHQRLGRFLSGRTTLIVAHRLSAVRQADRVCVFDAGRIIEEGRHEELVAADGLYARLYGRPGPASNSGGTDQ